LLKYAKTAAQAQFHPAQPAKRALEVQPRFAAIPHAAKRVSLPIANNRRPLQQPQLPQHLQAQLRIIQAATPHVT
jgi:hypothetical protein